MTKRVGTVEARQSFSRLVSEAGFRGEHIIVDISAALHLLPQTPGIGCTVFYIITVFPEADEPRLS
jgi:hypothetical protein